MGGGARATGRDAAVTERTVHLVADATSVGAELSVTHRNDLGHDTDDMCLLVQRNPAGDLEIGNLIGASGDDHNF
jgi:hypothetical protein